jgi:hypothetical protein
VVLAPFIPAAINVQNSGQVDAAPPALTSVSGFPVSAEVGAGPVVFDVDVGMSDALSGFGRGYISLYDANMIFAGSVPIFPSHLAAGTPQNGMYRVSFTIPQNTAPGVYYPLIGLYDDTFNQATFTDRPGGASFGDQPIPPVGTILSIEVTNQVFTFASWRASKFTTIELADPGISGPNADADKDGISNAVEYALGLEPKTPDASAWSASRATSGTASYLAISFSVPANFPSDATIIVEESPTLGAGSVWTPLASKTGTGPWSSLNGGVLTAAPEVNGFVPVTVRSPNAISELYPRGFMRLKVTVP